MSLHQASQNVWRLNKITTKLIAYLVNVDDIKKANSLIRILQLVDEAKIHQVKIAQSYRKTTINLREARNLIKLQNSPILGGAEDFFRLSSEFETKGDKND